MIAFGLPGAGNPVPCGEGLAIAVPQGWFQGRTAHGGWSAVLALAAARWLAEGQGAGPLPPLRSATVNFIGPVEGTVEARPRLLRRGRNAVWIGVELVSPATAAVLLQATFVFMQPRDSEIAIDSHPAPAGLGRPEEGKPVTYAESDPAFVRNFEMRRPLADTRRQPAHARWVRLADRAGADPEAELLVIADVLIPGAINWLGHRVPLSSMTWQVNLLGSPAAHPDGWWLVESRAVHAAGGLDTEQISLWDPAGRPVALCQQAVAVFG